MGIESKEMNAKNKLLLKFISLFIYSVIMLLFSFLIVDLFDIGNIFGLPAVITVFVVLIILYPILREIISLLVAFLIPSSNRLAFLRGQRYLYNKEQINQFKIGAKNKIDPSIYADPELSWQQMEQIRLALQSKLDVSAFLNPELSVEHMKFMRLCLELKIDVSEKIENYTVEEMTFILNNLNKGQDVSNYAKPYYNILQMQEIAEGLEKRIDVSIYADTKYTAEQMREILVGLDLDLDVSQYANPKYTSEEMRETRRRLYEESPNFDPYYDDWDCSL